MCIILRNVLLCPKHNCASCRNYLLVYSWNQLSRLLQKAAIMERSILDGVEMSQLQALELRTRPQIHASARAD